MRTIVYVDGFNLYYGAVKNTPYRWLDLLSLFRKVVGQSRQVVAIKHETGKSVGIAVPGPNRPSHALQSKADFTRRIRTGALASSLLPDPIPGTTIGKLPGW